MPPNYELREDGSYELREDGSIELREGEDAAVVTTPAPPPEVTFATWRPFAFRVPELAIIAGEAKGALIRVIVTLIPGQASAGAKAMGAVLVFRQPTFEPGKAIGIVQPKVFITAGRAEGLDTIAIDNAFLLELAAA